MLSIGNLAIRCAVSNRPRIPEKDGGWNLNDADNQRIDLWIAWPGVGVYIDRAHGGAGDPAPAFLCTAVGSAGLAGGCISARDGARANQSANTRQERCIVSGA